MKTRLANLPDELKTDIIRYAVLAPEDAIDIEQLPRTTDRLMSPFEHLEKLRQIAEDEVFRVNDFYLRLRDATIELKIPVVERLASSQVEAIENLQIRLDIFLEGGLFETVDHVLRKLQC